MYQPFQIASDKDGTEVLEALDRSQLVISGNSCSLAHWNSRLGFVGRPFIACISSLTAEGGVVPLMDIKVAKIYPVAFVLVQKGQGEPPWTVEEEHRRNDQWQVKLSR
jgi:breast cancer 2 susceptibility protein